MLRQDDPPCSTALLSLAEFTALIERQRGEVFGFLCSLVQHQEQASDLLQDTFCDAWCAAKRGQAPLVPGAPRDAVRRWLFRVAYRQAISALRRRQLIRWESLDAPGAPDWEALSSLASFEDQVVESAAMQAALADLPTRDATCLVLHVVQGFTAAETAEIMGDSPQAIAKRITRAKHRLLTAYLAHEAGEQKSRRP